VAQVVSKILSIFGGRSDRDEPQAVRTLKPSPLDHRLRSAATLRPVRAPEKVTAARMSFVGIAEVRKRLGDHWDEMSDKVMRVAGQLVERRLEPGDIFGSLGEAGFVIVFARLDPQKAEQRCRRIAAEISRFLLGEDIDPDKLRVGVDIGEISCEDVPAGNNLGDIARLLQGRARENARSSVSKPPPAKAPKQVDKQPAWERYMPVWCLAEGHINIYCLRVPPMSEFGVNLPRQDELDLMLFDRARRRLATLNRSKANILILCPVRFDTLRQQESLKKLTRLCDSLSEALRSRLVFEMRDIPEGVPQVQFDQAIAFLKKYAAYTAVRVGRFERSFTRYAAAKVRFAITDFSPLVGAEADAIPTMNRFVAASERVGMTSVGIGMDTTSLAVAAVSAGFDHISGKTVGGAVQTPGDIIPFNVTKLFSGEPS